MSIGLSVGVYYFPVRRDSVNLTSFEWKMRIHSMSISCSVYSFVGTESQISRKSLFTKQENLHVLNQGKLWSKQVKVHLDGPYYVNTHILMWKFCVILLKSCFVNRINRQHTLFSIVFRNYFHKSSSTPQDYCILHHHITFGVMQQLFVD